MTRFERGFSESTGLDLADAREQWGAFTRQLSDVERVRLERGGYIAGQREGRRFRDMFPVDPPAESSDVDCD